MRFSYPGEKQDGQDSLSNPAIEKADNTPAIRFLVPEPISSQVMV
jgi:hypothetical protein